MSIDRHEDIQPLLADHVLGGLSAEERRRVDAHVPTCHLCATELRELGQAFQGIGLAEEPVDPPAHLRERVLERLRGGTPAAPHEAPRADLEPRGPQYGAWLGLAAALILVLGAWLIVLQQRGRDLRDTLRTVEAESSRLAEQIAQNTAQADLVVSILTSPDLQRIDLQGFDRSREAVARAYWSQARGLVIVADRLPPPPAGRVYQVWLIGSASAGPVSAGLLDEPDSGRGMLIVPALRGVSGTVTVAVTDEPPGGLPSPTGGKHLAGS